MKKQMSLFVWAIAMFGMSPVWGATNFGPRAGSSADLSGMPATRDNTTVNYTKYQTRSTTQTYQSSDGANMYYTQPVKRSDLYKQYDSQNSATNVRTSRSETVRREIKRKYYLAHPFFQPLKGDFGSVTDFSYNMNKYDITLTPIESTKITDTKAKWDMSGFSIKEDFSYGITDRIAVLGMLQYDINEYKLDWSTAPDDKNDDNDLNLFGLGAQWRFIDNSEWIATASAYYQHQKDISNNFLLDIKAGYKIATSTIYGLVRGWYIDFDGDSYGNGITGIQDDGTPASLFLAYKTDSSSAFYIEGGLGVFSVLAEDWTLNLEAIFGDYDWHNQFNIKGAIGWQPNNWVALNLYAKTSLYDSADDKTLKFYWSDAETGGWKESGTAKLNNYNETTIGFQAIFTF